jgi:hypothetical protein
MKNLQVISPLLTSLLFGSMALAQAGNLPDAPQPQDTATTGVPLAQSPATETPSTQTPTTHTPNPAQRSSENKLVSQAAPYPRPQRGPMPPPRGRAYPSAFAPSRPPLSPLGALIGFGAGAALGASASGDQTTRGRVAGGLIGGAICALIGGAVGHAFSAVGHNFHDRNEWRDLDDAQERKHHKPVARPLEPDVQASSATTRAPSAGSL